MLNSYIQIPLHVDLFDQEESLTGEKIHRMQKRLKFENVLKNEKSLIRSIQKNLDMLFLSQEGELFFDQKFGLELWNHNFESKKLKHDERKEIEKDFINIVNKYEPRLKTDSHQIQVQFDDQVKLIDGKKANLHVITIEMSSILNEDLKSKETNFSHIFKVPIKVYYKI